MATKKLKPLALVGVRAALYARISDGDGDRSGSIEAQRADMERFAESLGWKVAGFWADDETGTREHRDGLDAMLTIASGSPRPFDVVLTVTMDRLGRGLPSAFITRELEKLGVHVRYVHQDFTGDDAATKIRQDVQRLVDGMIPALSRDATLARMSEYFRAGYYVGGQVPFGYETIASPCGRLSRHGEPLRKLVIVEQKAAVVKSAFQAVADGYGIAEARRLLSAAGGPQSFPGAAHLLQMPLYFGHVTWRDLTRESPELAIVSESLFQRVQQMVKEGKPAPRPSRSASTRSLPLRGRVHCSCGRLMSPYWARGGSGGKVDYYRCSSKIGCDSRRRSVNAEKLHAAILGEVEAIGRTPWRARMAAERIGHLATDGDALLEDLREAGRGVQRAGQAVRNLMETAAMVSSPEARKRLAGDIDRAVTLETMAKARLRLLENSVKATTQKVTAAALLERLKNISGLLSVATPEEKEKIVGLIACGVAFQESGEALVELCPLFAESGGGYLSEVRTQGELEGRSPSNVLTLSPSPLASNSPRPLRFIIDVPSKPAGKRAI
jgi:DNA invertase Pin-like site-specific DNA recombinase